LQAIEATLLKQRDLHSPKPRVISVTQSTELGTVYTQAELGAISEFSRARDLSFHMDGARFANAVGSLGCSPRSLTWDLDLDVLCFGGTKNGAGGGELVVFFNKEMAREFDYRAKQAARKAAETK
jgi:threonine aldolase